MKRVITLAVLASVACILVLAFDFLPLEKTLSARLETESQVINLGDVSQGIHECEFVIFNVSNEPISIVDAIGSCNCVRIELSHRKIQQGGNARVVCQWDTRNEYGSLTTVVNIVYGSQESGEMLVLPLSIKGVVQQSISFAPLSVVIHEGKSSSQIVRFNAEDSSAFFQIVSVETTNPGVHATICEDQQGVAVTYSGAHLPGFASMAFLNVETDFNRQKYIRVPLQLIRNE